MLDEQQLDQEKQITLKDYLHILHRGRWIILSSFITVMAATIYFTYTTTPVYQASTKVIIKDDGNVGESLFEVGGLIKKETMINNQVEILKSRTLAETVIQRLKESEFAGQLKILTNGSN
ncbi:hypothetical protein KC734_12030, partial [candidate division KSB1 bacterium]|nr:hypothetical protein [candidate division KSB1 bacterium]